MMRPLGNRRRRVVTGFVCTTTAGVGALAAGTLMAPAARAASTPPGATTANVVVGSAITLTNLSPSFTLSGNPGDVPAAAAVSYTVTTNNATGYNVTVQPETATLVGTGTNTATIPFSSLQVDGTALPAPAPATPVQVHNQTTPSLATGDNLTDNYTMPGGIPFVAPDTYTGKIDYVATTNP